MVAVAVPAAIIGVGDGLHILVCDEANHGICHGGVVGKRTGDEAVNRMGGHMAQAGDTTGAGRERRWNTMVAGRERHWRAMGAGWGKRRQEKQL